MKKRSILNLLAIAVFFSAGSVFAQDRGTGSIKGKVRVTAGTPDGVAIIIKEGDREVAHGVSGKNGDFEISHLAPARYSATFRKPGLSVGTIADIEVKAGKTRSLGDRLVLNIDEGSIAFIKGVVFNQYDRSAPGVRIELARIEGDGTTRKIDSGVSNETGSFTFRLVPDPAKYRITAKPGNGDPVSRDVEIDGAAIYRTALSLKPRVQ
ncbi:MAG TPA: carboxypeptidase-like regulatory domain-containing protein [Pyrinomonadaceae bacterium]|nr:carboxypeptidase-like regulatory domain-containing protein [Pyrinomonadaceae bacterium]